MSEGSFLSPLRIEALEITGSSLDIAKPLDNDNYNVLLTLNMGQTPLENTGEEEGHQSYRVMVPLTVGVSLEDPREGGVQYANAQLKGLIAVTLPKSAYRGDNPLMDLRVNCVSMLYSHMRSYLMSMTAQTPLRGFMLPAINPAAYVRSVLTDGADEGESE